MMSCIRSSANFSNPSGTCRSSDQGQQNRHIDRVLRNRTDGNAIDEIANTKRTIGLDKSWKTFRNHEDVRLTDGVSRSISVCMHVEVAGVEETVFIDTGSRGVV